MTKHKNPLGQILIFRHCRPEPGTGTGTGWKNQYRTWLRTFLHIILATRRRKIKPATELKRGKTNHTKKKNKKKNRIQIKTRGKNFLLHTKRIHNSLRERVRGFSSSGPQGWRVLRLFSHFRLVSSIPCSVRQKGDCTVRKAIVCI